MKKTVTMKLGSFDYAKVKDRIQEFRKDCPNGLIETTPTITDTHIIFKARILKDKSDVSSAEATGHSMGELGGEKKKEKVFEKQESIAVGRALALLGYGADGEIASSEEMEEFLAHKQEQLAEQIMEVTDQVGHCETIDQLKELYANLSGEMKTHTKEAFTQKRKELGK